MHITEANGFSEVKVSEIQCAFNKLKRNAKNSF